MPDVTGECGALSAWVVAGWPFLFILFFFSFSSGYIICALAHAASERHEGGKP